MNYRGKDYVTALRIDFLTGNDFKSAINPGAEAQTQVDNLIKSLPTDPKTIEDDMIENWSEIEMKVSGQDLMDIYSYWEFVHDGRRLGKPESDDYDIYCKFDINKHRKVYSNYLEVIVLADGSVKYAVPSHQEALIAIGMKQHKVSRDQYINMCPKEYYADYVTWLLNDTNTVAVWSDGYIGCTNISKAQKETLNKFKRYGLMKNRLYLH